MIIILMIIIIIIIMIKMRNKQIKLFNYLFSVVFFYYKHVDIYTEKTETMQANKGHTYSLNYSYFFYIIINIIIKYDRKWHNLSSDPVRPGPSLSLYNPFLSRFRIYPKSVKY